MSRRGNINTTDHLGDSSSISTVVVAILVLGCGLTAGLFPTTPLASLLVPAAGLGAWVFYHLNGTIAEKVLGLYWLTFCLFSTALASYVVNGMFNIFYLGLALAVFASLLRSELLIDKPATWLLSGLFVVVSASLVGYLGPLSGTSLDRLLFVPLAVIAAFIVASGRSLRPLLHAMILSSLVVAVWVIATAASAGFAYRGSLSLDQNVVSYYVGIGFALLCGSFVTRVGASASFFIGSGRLLILATLGYAILLLASRGAMIAIALVMVAALLVSIGADIRRVWRVGLLLALTVSALLLPGGKGVLQRFSDPSTETGGGRVLIWETVIDATRTSRAKELLLGHGMSSSERLIRHEFGYLGSTHNSFLLILYDYGSIGLLLFAALHVLIFARLVRRRDTLGMQLMLLFVFQFSTGLFITASDSYLYWLALGLMLGATSARVESSETEGDDHACRGATRPGTNELLS